MQILRKAAMMAEVIAPAQVRSRGSCADLRAICMRTVIVINKAPAERDEEADSAISCSLALVCIWVLVCTLSTSYPRESHLCILPQTGKMRTVLAAISHASKLRLG